MPVKLLGRYDVINELGRGAQSIMYLAKDTRMSRQVAVKKIGPGSSAQNDGLLREARIVSNLHHHNIIPLYDLGAAEGVVYLVYAYVAGESLAQVLKRSGAMPVAAAVRTALDVLDALSSAHGQGIVHLDIKPSNVLISQTGQHFLMDFGIARAMPKKSNATDEAGGSLQYLAPEAISAQGGELRSDIYSVGMMLYEMMTFQAEGKNAASPPAIKVKIDKQLEKIILKATEKKPEARYSSASEMRQALLEYLDTAKEAAAGSPDADIASTLRFLLRRIRSKTDFPAMSGVIHEINKIVASDEEDSSKLAQVILQDFSLTNKMLKLVNTVSYSQFGGKINTISKAVAILGFEPVRNIAMSLIVMDFLQNKSQAQELKDVVVSSFFSGIVAVQLAEWKSAQEVEEAMICAMFFNLGRMLTKFYFFDESLEIARVMENQGVDEDQAALEVLGISYNELGIGIARSWNFPESLIEGMQKIKSDKALAPEDNIGRLNVVVNMANELCSVAATTDPKAKEEALQKIRMRYSGVAEASEEKLSSALASSLQDLSQRARVLGIETAKSPLLNNMQVWVRHKNAPKDGSSSADSASGITPDELEEKINIEALLRAGLQDVTNTMAGEYKLNEVLQMVLETIYRGLGFRHVIIFSRDAKKNMMVARFGFGANIADILPGLHFSLNFEADVFHLSLAKGLDIVIEDVGAPNIANKIPAWHGKAVDSRYFMLLPIMVNNIAVGLIYADMLEAKKLQVTANEMSLLRNLRNQAVLAIQKKT
jgi:serine/threonine protein kinase